MSRKSIDAQTYVDVWHRQDGKCGLCGEDLNDAPREMHHMKRVADEGTNEVDNLVLLCSRECHDFVHDYNFRKELETTADVYPYFNGGEDEIIEAPEILETFDDETDLIEDATDVSEIEEGGESL